LGTKKKGQYMQSDTFSLEDCKLYSKAVSIFMDVEDVNYIKAIAYSHFSKKDNIRELISNCGDKFKEFIYTNHAKCLPIKDITELYRLLYLFGWIDKNNKPVIEKSIIIIALNSITNNYEFVTVNNAKDLKRDMETIIKYAFHNSNITILRNDFFKFDIDSI
jgi:hypothetical protein